MRVQLISYDLRRPGQDYSGLYEAIKALGGWWHLQQSVWLVSTRLTCTQVRDALLSHIDQNDKLAVCTLGGDWATYGHTVNWLQQNLAA